MTPRYAVWQNAQQLPLFLQGERPQRKPWLAFFGWLLAGLAWPLAGFLAGFLAWLLAGSLAGLVWLLAGLVWLMAGFLAGLVWVWFGSWLAFWLVWFGSWLAFWLVWLGFLFFLVFLARLAETQLLGILQAYLGVIILQPHACTQRFRLRILRRTRSNAGRTSARSLSGRIESIWETPSKERGELSWVYLQPVSVFSHFFVATADWRHRNDALLIHVHS